MLDFKELPSDGVRFEQLIRELLIRLGLEFDPALGSAQTLAVIWLSRRGRLASSPLWHASGWSVVSTTAQHRDDHIVGLDDISGITDACSAVDASGFLLATSTQPSAAVVGVWKNLAVAGGSPPAIGTGSRDRETPERARDFSANHQFSRRALSRFPGSIYNTTKPSFWAAELQGLLSLSVSRTANLYPKLKDVEEIVRRVEEHPRAGRRGVGASLY